MCDKRLVLSEIGQIIETIDVVLRRTKDVQILNDFLLSESGMILLDSVCMKLIQYSTGSRSGAKTTGWNAIPMMIWTKLQNIWQIWD